MRSLSILILFLTSFVFIDAQETDTIVDPRDGQVYNIVKIGNQWWMAENLRAASYSDDTPIANVTDSATWSNLTTGAYCWWNNDSATHENPYGKLYTWYTVETGNLCPTGWHVPSDAEWKGLEMYLGMSQEEADNTDYRGTDEGGKMKETGTTHWFSPNTGATNTSGFTGIPGGYRFNNFVNMGNRGYHWSSTESSSSNAWYRDLVFDNSAVGRHNSPKGIGVSVRCLRNVLPPDTIIAEPGDQEVSLKWISDSIGNIDMYRIYRDGNLIDSIEISGVEDTIYVDSGLVNYAEYSYYITSLDSFGNQSISSDTVSAIPFEIVEDYDGNTYSTVKIGDQIWMRENLKTTHYADGISLVDGTGAGDITGDYTTKYYFWYNDDSLSYADTYGALYTWTGIMNGTASSDANPSGVQGVCPNGWHLPSDDEWKELEMFLGMSQVDADGEGYRGTDEGGKLKETGTAHWFSPNTGATNTSGFTAMPGGYRLSGFVNMGNRGYHWSSTESSSSNAWTRDLDFGNSTVARYNSSKSAAISVRCIMNGPNLPPVADAGPDQDVIEGDTVILDGQGSNDPDGDSLIFIWTAPTAFTLSDSSSASPTFISPEVIADTIFVITLVVNDSSLDSDPDTILLTVRQLNKVPEITGQELLITDEDTELTLLLSDFTITDADNDSTDMTLLVQDGTDYSRTVDTITPDADYYGTLTVPVRVTDGTDTSIVFNASVSVTAINDPPVIISQIAVSSDEDMPFDIQFSDLVINDPDNDTSEMSLTVYDSINYSVSGTTVTPDQDFSDSLIVPVSVSDTSNTSNVFLLTATITTVNDAPVITGQNPVSVTEDMPFDIQFSDLVINDPDNDTSEMSLVVYDSVNYSVSGTTVIPDPDFSDTLIVYVSVSDTSNTSNVFLLSATITPVNDAPVITGQNPVSVTEDNPFDILWSDLIIDDPDNDSTDFIILISDSTNYTFSVTTVTPAQDFTGTLYIPLMVSDGSLTSDRLVISVTVSPVNDAPQITGQLVINAIEDSSFIFHADQLVITDPDNAAGDFNITVSDSLNYSVTDSTINPDSGFTGTLHIPVRISDGVLSSNEFVASVSVVPRLVVEVAKTNVTLVGGHNGMIDMTVSGGTSPYQYDWNTGAFTQDVFFLYPGIYTVTVTDAGIQSVILSIEITQPQVQSCDITVEISYEVDSVTQEVDFTPSTTEYELFWEFGDGGVSSLSSPTYIYSYPGLYQVCLSAFDDVSDCSYETCVMVEVGSPECIADFNFYVDESDSMLLHFSDNSYGAVSSWYWNFADGNISTDQDVDHQFKQAGTFQVCLFTLDNAAGCLSEVCKEISIGSVELVADFNYFVNPVTLKTIFTNNSSGDITDYYWTYGDGSVYSGKDSSHVYADPGIYNVCLSVKNSSTGTFTELCKEIKAGTLPCNITAAYSYFVNPDTRKVSFTNVSSGKVDSYYWNFGDGVSSSSASPVHQYGEPGYYLVSLSIRDDIANCNDFHAELIQVGQAECKALFKYSVNPQTLTVSMEDLSLGDIQDYFWTFDDGFTATRSDPVHQYTKEGLYEISLTVTDVTGTCMDYVTSQVQVGYVDCSADFTVFIDSSENTAYFSSQSLGRQINYYWIFGDGKMSTDKDPVHMFSVPGYHKVSLNTYNELSGCMDYNEQIILIGSQGIDCEADFIYRTDETTHTVTFADKSLGEGLSWFWNFGDNKSSTPTSNLKDPEHIYTKGGIYNVCLTVYSSSGIQNTSCKQVFAGAPATGNCLAQFIYTVDDADRKVNFNDESYGEPDSWDWEFGDGQTSIIEDPENIYSQAGYYTSHLRIENQSAGCFSDAFAMVSVAKEGGLIAGFGYTYDSILETKAESYPVDYVGVTLGDASKYKWSFGDGQHDSTTTTPTHVYTSPGIYEVCLTIYDEVAGTEDSTCSMVTVPQSTFIGELFIDPELNLQCYPNPAEDIVYVAFDLPSEAFTEVTVYTISGKKLRSVVYKKLSSGRYLFELDATDMPDGLYIIKLNSNIRMVTKIMSIQH